MLKLGWPEAKTLTLSLVLECWRQDVSGKLELESRVGEGLSVRWWDSSNDGNGLTTWTVVPCQLHFLWIHVHNSAWYLCCLLQCKTAAPWQHTLGVSVLVTLCWMKRDWVSIEEQMPSVFSSLISSAVPPWLSIITSLRSVCGGRE